MGGQAYDRSTRSQVQTAISQLMVILRDAGLERIITKRWNSIAIDKTQVSCDYYDLLDGKPQALNAYTGEYLIDYSWAEFTTMQLLQRKY